MPADTTGAGALPAPRDPFRPYRVCLVCLGNICRSPMAEVVLRDELERAGLGGAVTVGSAGTGDWHLGGPMDTRARAELARRGYDGSAHRARQFTASWFGREDLVLALDRSNLANLRAMAPDAESAAWVRLLRTFDPAFGGPDEDPCEGEVPDPYGGAPADYAFALDLILPAARGLAARLSKFLGPQATGRGER